jgi:hypothetical protein
MRRGREGRRRGEDVKERGKNEGDKSLVKMQAKSQSVDVFLMISVIQKSNM